MKAWKILSTRLTALFRREAVLADMDEEMHAHLDLATEAHIRRGMSPEEARRAARAEFGNYGSLRDRAWEVRGGGFLEVLAQDVRYATRMLAKRPAFTLVAVLTLALGIGANTAIFSAVEAVLLRDLPFRHAERVVVLWEHNRIGDRPHNVLSPANFSDWQEQARSFDRMAAFIDQRYNLTGEGNPEEVPSQLATPELFELLGVEAALGRTFTAEDVEAGRDVAVISHGLWQRRFGGRADAVGRPISLDGSPVTIVGVLPPGFRWFVEEGSLTGRPAELWRPLPITEEMRVWRGRYLSAVARLAPGVSVDEARAEMDAVAARLEQQHPEANTGWGATVEPVRDQLAGEIRPALLVLLGAVAFVLLIACVNVANLLLARAAERQQEIAVRSAIGAGRRRIVRQLLTESLLLALLGGGLGLLLARWGLGALVALAPEHLLGAGEVGVNGAVLAFTLGVSLVTGVVFGLLPALEAAGGELGDPLKEGGRGRIGSRRGARVRDALIVAEVALALVLLVGAGLMTRSFLGLTAVDPGFEAENLLTLKVSLPPAKYPEPGDVVAFFHQATESLETLPGVRSAAAVSALPFADLGAATSFSVEGRPEPAPGEEPVTDVRVVDRGYFETMGIPLVAGRVFTEVEGREDRSVAVVNQEMVRRYFAGEDPIGRRIFVDMKEEPYPTEIIGVVGDARYRELEGEMRPMVYWTPPQLPYPSMTLVLRTTVEPESLAGAARGEILAIDPDQPVSEVRPMAGWLAEAVARPRFGTVLLAGFAALALLLAGVGIYGVMSHAVIQRRGEIGIRMAMGAAAGDVLRLVVGRGLALVGAGVLLGLAAALALTRVLESLLYQVSATDPWTFAALALLLALVSGLVCLVPAWRAARLDPLVALRSD